MRTLRRVVLPGLAAAVLLTGCGTAAQVRTGGAPNGLARTRPASGQVSTSRVVTSRAAAVALARAIVTEVVLPPGSRAVEDPPAHILRAPGGGPITPDAAHLSRFATTTGSMAATFAYLQSHPPAGYVREGSGTATSTLRGAVEEETVMDAVGPAASGGGAATLDFSIAPLAGGGAGIRVDAYVTWLPTKPAAATVPAQDRVAVVSIAENTAAETWKKERLPVPRKVTVTAPALLRELRAAADGLAMAMPGVLSCPADLGSRYTVAFAASPDARPNRTFATGSCGEVSVTGPSGGTIATLAGDPALGRAYQRVLAIGAG